MFDECGSGLSVLLCILDAHRLCVHLVIMEDIKGFLHDFRIIGGSIDNSHPDITRNTQLSIACMDGSSLITESLDGPTPGLDFVEHGFC